MEKLQVGDIVRFKLEAWNVGWVRENYANTSYRVGRVTDLMVSLVRLDDMSEHETACAVPMDYLVRVYGPEFGLAAENVKTEGGLNAPDPAYAKEWAESVFYQDPLCVDDLGTAQSIEAIIQERGTRYGRFDKHALITQALKDIMHGGHVYIDNADVEHVIATNWDTLAPDQKEALEMVAHKIGRILNGDPDYADSWVDIAGYSKLVADRLEEKGEHANG